MYGHERRRKNFVFQLWSALTEGREFRTPGDQIGTPTAAANAAEVVRDLVDAGERGIFHVAGAERMLRSELALVAAEELGLDPGLIRPIPTASWASPRPPARRRATDRPRRAPPRARRCSARGTGSARCSPPAPIAVAGGAA